MLQEATEATYGFRPSYRKIWLAKQKAMAQIYGDWEESYGDLSHWIIGVTSTMDGTVALLKIYPVRVGDQVDESRVFFHRMFWTFPSCIEAFRHCKSLVIIDGTHLYGKYGGTLLLAIAQDGNSNILALRLHLWRGKMQNPGHTFYPTLEDMLLHRKVAANFALTFKGKESRRWLVNAAYAKMEAEFDYWFDIMRTENPAMCDWANRMEYERWTQHKDGGRRYGHMTTNISECVNSVLKGTRNLPVTSLVKSTYLRLAELFVIRGQTVEAQLASGHQFSQALVKAIERILRDSRCFTVTLFDRHQAEYTVGKTTPTGKFSLGSYRVSLRDRTCDCGYFQALHYPCYHAITCCAQSRLDWATYVDEVYSMSEVFKVYQISFVGSTGDCPASSLNRTVPTNSTTNLGATPNAPTSSIGATNTVVATTSGIPTCIILLHHII
ncbi:uncharacterized protein LOC130965931 [Arachis stenosperma]|uniref:uncharacterized protein LOC130965931 n=1 Tax=Arachis stenosperma TaxID=217475 RepID=UPI0025AC7F89|nr:uncharacterized protein LOC130965931 [Arachis stenosperma]